jgi:hypothetical protein
MASLAGTRHAAFAWPLLGERPQGRAALEVAFRGACRPPGGGGFPSAAGGV